MSRLGAPNLDVPIPGDYDGVGKADLAVYRPSTAQWFILHVSGATTVLSFGAPRLDIPITGDFDGDGKTDIGLFRPTTDQWIILRSTAGGLVTSFGASNLDVPLQVPLAYRYKGATKAPSAPSSFAPVISQLSAGPQPLLWVTPEPAQPSNQPTSTLAQTVPPAGRRKPNPLALDAAIDQLWP
jgi:hypothetical protein